MPDKEVFKRRKDQLPPDDLASYVCNKKWYIFYLRSHAEQLVCDTLTNLNYKVFLPVISSLKIWKNRQKKIIKRPLFPNYIFVYAYAHEIYAIRRLSKVVNVVCCGGKPCTVSDKEIEGIRQMLSSGQKVTAETKYSKGECVRIVSGPLKGYEGILVKQHSRTRFGIHLNAINCAAFIEVRLTDLQRI